MSTLPVSTGASTLEASAPTAGVPLPWGARVSRTIERWIATTPQGRRHRESLLVEPWGSTWVRVTWRGAAKPLPLRIRPGHNEEHVCLEMLEQGAWHPMTDVGGVKFGVTSLEATLTRWMRYQGRLGVLWTLWDVAASVLSPASPSVPSAHENGTPRDPSAPVAR